jgi:hypothetical protein
MKKDLEKELEQRGTAEISNGIVTQVTQALDEKPDKVKMLVFGEQVEKGIIHIEQACAKCKDNYYVKLGGKDKCREFQKKDAEARGFSNLVCPNQFID